MIKAIFFDWFNTLVHFDPPRAELYRRAFQRFGIELPFKQMMRSILAADLHYFKENARLPVGERTAEEQAEVYSYYPKLILAEAGIEVDEALPLKVLGMVREEAKRLPLVLFDDVPPALKMLKERGIILGLLTNATEGMLSLHSKLGLEDYLDLVVTSREAGAEKPAPPIFLFALERAGVEAFEALHVGDQYDLDMVGAREVGIGPVLVDRYDLFPDVSDCLRIRSLTELVQHL